MGGLPVSLIELSLLRRQIRLFVRFFHDAAFVAGPFAIPFGIALVVFLFAFGDTDFGFDMIVFPVQGEGDGGIAFTLYRITDFLDFGFLQQQFSGTQRVRNNVCRCRLQRGDVRTEQKTFTAFDDDITISQVAFASTQGFDFPALQGQAGFVAIFNEIVEFGLAVEGYCAALGVLGFTHDPIVFRVELAL